MAITDELRTPIYFAAGTADYAVQQAKKVPALIEKIQAEAPARIDAVRKTDPKAVQDKAVSQAKEAQATAQAKFNEIFSTLDTDLKKFGETTQDFALRSVGLAAEYAVKAREAYEKVAEHGEQAVKQWRGEAAEEIVEIAAAVEPDEEPAAAGPAVAEEPKTAKAEAKPAPAKKPAARKTAAKKTTPAAEK
ncbi:hypothetical protein [Streptomyces beijiangensis]|uniref:Heparin binding hemagglutinin HbhA n=1 Tax=Streptomyces beijiangensis TaxID=163361 RepID=A0A939F4S8_9ACTN|nr:hypothetical protein [Streptomyces beijiangensis]MBO0512556.1 hypothetical protein [Streptomyces beijiangensis]